MPVATINARANDSRLRPQVKAAAKAGGQSSFAEAFAQIVAVLMRDPNFRSLTLSDLEWLVLPPVMVGQFGLAHAPMQRPVAKAEKSGETQQNRAALVPVAVALWARVSDSLDKTLSDELRNQPKLRPADWVSGDNLWLITVAGDRRALPKFLDQLTGKDFKGKQIKMRVRGPDGKVIVKTLG